MADRNAALLDHGGATRAACLIEREAPHHEATIKLISDGGTT